MICIKTINEIDLYINENSSYISDIDNDMYYYRGIIEGIDFAKNAFIYDDKSCKEKVVFLLDCMKKKLEYEKMQGYGDELYIDWIMGYIKSLEWFLCE